MTDETHEERLQRLKKQNFAALNETGGFLALNRPIAKRIMRDELNAPNDDFAEAAINLCLSLLGAMARELSNDVDLREFKPDLNS